MNNIKVSSHPGCCAVVNVYDFPAFHFQDSSATTEEVLAKLREIERDYPYKTCIAIVHERQSAALEALEESEWTLLATFAGGSGRTLFIYAKGYGLIRKSM